MVDPPSMDDIGVLGTGTPPNERGTVLVFVCVLAAAERALSHKSLSIPSVPVCWMDDVCDHSFSLEKVQSEDGNLHLRCCERILRSWMAPDSNETCWYLDAEHGGMVVEPISIYTDTYV